MPRASFLSVLTGREEALGMARLDAHDRYTRLAKSPVQPFRQRTGLDPGNIDDTGPLYQAFD